MFKIWDKTDNKEWHKMEVHAILHGNYFANNASASRKKFCADLG
jgi:hypothetical protein